MMRNTVSLAAALLLLTAVASAATITPSTVDATVKPDTAAVHQLQVDVPTNESVSIQSTEGWMLFSQTSFSDGTHTFNATTLGRSPGNHTAYITNGSNKLATIKLHVKRDRKVLFDGWINASKGVNIEGQTWDVMRISQSLHLRQDSINETVTIDADTTKTVNGIDVTVADTIPNAYAKVKATTTENSGVFTPVTIDTGEEKQEECKLAIDPVNRPYRGNKFFFEVVKNNEPDVRVSGVQVVMYDAGTRRDSLIGGSPHTTDSSGQVFFHIPKSTEGPLIISLDGSDTSCEDNTIRKSFGLAYPSYLDRRAELQLMLNLSNKTVTDKIKGVILNREKMEVDTGVVRIKKPDNTISELSFDDAKFTFDPQSHGIYEVRATKQNYRSSKWKQVEVLQDSDGDGVPDPKDDCNGVKGKPKLNGCKADTQFKLFTEDGEPVDEATVGESYVAKLLRGNETVSASGTIAVKNNGETVKSFDMEDGETTVSFTGAATYIMAYNGSDQTLSNVKGSVTVEQAKGFIQKVNPKKLLISIAGTISLIVIAGLFYRRRRRKPSPSPRDRSPGGGSSLTFAGTASSPKDTTPSVKDTQAPPSEEQAGGGDVPPADPDEFGEGDSL